jgi:hypothetical protein
MPTHFKVQKKLFTTQIPICKKKMSGCYYLTIQGQAFGYTQLIPLMFIITMTVVKMITSNCIWFIFGIWLYLPQYILWCFQRYFFYIRSDPICASYQSFAFPSIESFYLGVVIGLFITWTIMYQVDQSVFVWCIVYTLGIVVPGILIFTGFNVWWETLFSVLFGFLMSWLFVFVTNRILQKHVKYLVHFFPLWHFGYKSKWVNDRKFKKINEALRILNESN